MSDSMYQRAPVALCDRLELAGVRLTRSLHNIGHHRADGQTPMRLLQAYFSSRGIEFEQCSDLTAHHAFEALAFLEHITTYAIQRSRDDVDRDELKRGAA